MGKINEQKLLAYTYNLPNRFHTPFHKSKHKNLVFFRLNFQGLKVMKKSEKAIALCIKKKKKTLRNCNICKNKL